MHRNSICTYMKCMWLCLRNCTWRWSLEHCSLAGFSAGCYDTHTPNTMVVCTHYKLHMHQWSWGWWGDSAPHCRMWVVYDTGWPIWVPTAEVSSGCNLGSVICSRWLVVMMQCHWKVVTWQIFIELLYMVCHVALHALHTVYGDAETRCRAFSDMGHMTGPTTTFLLPLPLLCTRDLPLLLGA